MEIALNSDKPGGFTHENAIASQNGLALLASITLKNALNINSNNNKNKDSTTKSKSKITKNNNNSNHLSLNHSKNDIKHHKAQQPQNGFISSSTNAASSLSSSLQTSATANATTEQKNVFTFTSAGLQALTATALSTIENEIRATAVDQQNNRQVQILTKAPSTGLTTVAALSANNSNSNNHHTSLSTNHQTNKTLSGKDPTVALLEALSIKTKKKQQNVSSQQQQKSTSSSSVTATTHSLGGTVGNNNTNNGGNGNGNSNKNNFRIPSDILDDLASRFIINVPDMELSNLIRICFQIELAHWFYLDFFCSSEEEKKLQPCGIKQFALHLFEHIPFLRQHLSSIDKILEDWKNYKLSVPTYGAILISEDLNYCLLVQSYFAKSSWGFPKGKVNENEDPVHCATREVYEETGYDITELIVPNDYIEAVINYQYTRLYIVRDVSLETKFSPRTRNEIKCCDWFPIDSLPVNKTDAISKPKLGRNANSFFMIMPFVKRLKKWVNDKRNGVETRRKYSSGGSPLSTSPLTTTIIGNGQMKSSCKKQKRNNSNNFNDDINALNNNTGGGAATAALTTFSCGNNTNVNCSNSNSNRSKRQRHKSMGDLDGIKLNNFNNSNNQSNCKTTNNNNNNNNCCSTTASSGTTTTCNGGNISCNNINTNNNNNNIKRHSKIVAAGSNVSNTTNGCINNNINNNSNVNNGGSSSSSSKRQLFQSQANNLQQNGEKIVSSFDLIRKEKQQMKAALAKAQKQQQNVTNNNGRQRAKSQSDKMCMQQQQQQQQQKSNGNSSNNKQQQRIQKQQSLTVTNSNMQNYNINGNKNHSNNNNGNGNIKSNVNNSFNNNKVTTGLNKIPTPPPLSGNDLLSFAAAAAAATSIASQQLSQTTICGHQQQQNPRPSSVSLHFPEVAPITTESTGTTGNQMLQFKRMPSATNLRILKRSTSHQPTQQNQQPQPPQRQASALQFTPSFNSWTNFTFTKNFIANVFC